MNSRYCILIVFVVGLSGCPAARSPTVTDAANKWWSEATPVYDPEKVGTVTPPRTVTLRDGRKVTLKKHIQTKKEETDQLADVQWATRLRAMVRGFGAEGNTFFVLTKLTPAETKDAQELCHMAGAFIWAKDNRHFGLDNINVIGSHNERLSYRIGLKGDVR